ncbi:MAG: extracellular solute-binding protein [Herbinix sp.]|jgi:raffinose/stachyose/melibiose transport system substrate-binding protein|nr:extracellular solute-binding protein [Herbinix sp.]
MKKMKRMISLMVTIVLMLSLAACGKSADDTSDGTNAITKTPEATQDKDSEEAEEPAEPREVELSIMMSFPQYMDQWETYCKQFEDKMLSEENIKVKINLEMPSSDQYDSVLQARLTGDDAPDLYTIHSNNIKTYNEAGYLTDLSSEALAGKIFDNVKKTVSVDEKLLALPIESTAWGVLYNKDIFEACGLQVPNTLDELNNVCKVLKEKGYTPFLLAYQEQWVPQLMTALSIGGKVSGELPDWLDRMYADNGSYSEISDIFGVIDVVMQNGTERAMEEGSEAGSADFANGKAAMYLQGTWASNTIITTNPEMNMGVYALPVNNNQASTLINLSTSTTLGVYPDSENLDIALKFANYVLDDKASSALFQGCGFNPIATVHDYETSSWVKEAYQYVEAGRSYQDLVLPNAVTDEQGKLLQEYYVGAVTKEEIIEALDAKFQEANKLSK